MRGHFRDQLWGLASHPAKVGASSHVLSAAYRVVYVANRRSIVRLKVGVTYVLKPLENFNLLLQPVYASSGDEGMLKEWDVVALALKREIDLGGMLNRPPRNHT